ncbi:MAG TPA: HAMP domain-containing sensor histidine kinase [Gemmatimonadaceae bacterium]|nr:HAMP domain-containing sensor histidine kinase [Gemmatimonadaceae bacterium]
MRRGALILVAVAVVVLLGSYVAYSRRVVRQLQAEASRTGQMYAQIYRALSDTSADPDAALFDLAEHIRDAGIPLILTDPNGKPTAVANLPFDAEPDDPRVLEWIARLDRENAPVVEKDAGTVHYGDTPLVRGLRIIPGLQAVLLLGLVVLGGYALRVRGRAEREQVWAGMARESAHQLGTPLSSLDGWIDVLREKTGEGDELTQRALRHMDGDLERLRRVAHRFERIGRPPSKDQINLTELLERVTTYFRARVPSLAHSVRIETKWSDEPLEMAGDAVLIEWALEAIIKNSIDALAGRGGTITVAAEHLPEGVTRVRFSDDGPGIPREIRPHIFDAGFSTKEQGWGIGLALARRIVSDAHGGKLELIPSDKGATFEITFPG